MEVAVEVAVEEAVAEEEAVAVAEEESPREEEPQQAHLLSQENWEATHQKNSTATGRKANHSSLTSSCTEE